MGHIDIDRIASSCAKPGCSRVKIHARGLCNPHYNKEYVTPKIEKQCEVCGSSFRVYPSNSSQRYCTARCKDKTTVTHGHGRVNGKPTPTYLAWRSMLVRCLNPKVAEYPNYGGRGITVCERWLRFENFLADMRVRPDGLPRLSLDRINNDGNYEPGNCRWATGAEQNRNKNNNRLLTIDGQTRCVTEWAEISGIDKNRIYQRVNKGWNATAAVFTPVALREKYDKRKQSEHGR